MLEPSSPEVQASARPDPVPWGLAAAVGSLLLSFILYVVGEAPYVYLATGLHKSHLLLFEIGAYQFLLLGVVVSAVLFIGIGYHVGPRALGYRWPGWERLGRALVALPILYVGVVLLYFLFDTLLPGYGLHGNTEELLPTHHGTIAIWIKIVVFLWAAVEAPFTEETLFRGILYQGLRHFCRLHMSRPAAIGVAAVISGVLFGLAHFELHTLPILALLGIGLALIFEYADSIYASTLIHGIVNAFAVLNVLGVQ